MLDESRAIANVCVPVPELTRAQKLTELSTTDDGRDLTNTPTEPPEFVNRAPYDPECAAAEDTATEPVPAVPSHAPNDPDSNPSENTTVG